MTTTVAVLRDPLFSLAELESVIPLVRASVSPTPQYAWPLLKAHIGVDVVVKHENHTPIGSFKVRGGLVYFERLKRRRSGGAGSRHRNARKSWAIAGFRGIPCWRRRDHRGAARQFDREKCGDALVGR